MKTILPALLVAVGLFLVSCDKDERICNNVTESSPEFLSYWYFPEGSYWVYELQGSGGISDTVTLVKSEARFYQPDDLAARVPCNMVYRQTLAHSNDTYFPATDSNPDRLEKYEGNGVNLFLDRTFNISRFPANGPIFNLPVAEGRLLYTDLYMGDTSTFITASNEIVPTVEIRNTALLDSTESNFGKSFYFTKDVGITKRVYSNNQVWVLKSYFINK